MCFSCVCVLYTHHSIATKGVESTHVYTGYSNFNQNAIAFSVSRCHLHTDLPMSKPLDANAIWEFRKVVGIHVGDLKMKRSNTAERRASKLSSQGWHDGNGNGFGVWHSPTHWQWNDRGASAIPKIVPPASHSRFYHSIYILRASQWSLQIINKTLCRNGFSSCEPRKAAAKQMTRRNKIFISCFQKSMGKVNGNWKAWVTSFNQKQHSGETRSHLVFKAVKYQCIQALTIPRQKVSIELSRVAEGKQ